MAKKKKDTSKALTKAEIESFKALLVAKYNEILGNVVSMENESLHREQTDLSKVPIHLGDAGSDTYEIDNTLGLVDSERKLLEEIIQALERIEEGTYGICLGSGKPIGKARLTAIPWAKYCIEYANLLDQGLVNADDTYDDTDDDTDHTDKTAA